MQRRNFIKTAGAAILGAAGLPAVDATVWLRGPLVDLACERARAASNRLA